MKNQKEKKVLLIPLQEHEKEKFITDIQAAFKIAVIEEFGDDGNEVIPREDVEQSFNAAGAEIYHIVYNGQIAGGTVIVINPETNLNSLDLFFINPNMHSKGIGLAAWHAIEKLHPETKIWETHTPYFEKRNIHFYVNKCGFHIVEFYNPHHREVNEPSSQTAGGDYFFRFEKKMK